jgi:Raf kinase inhibitor-like YbhB/YbcL family protein
MQLRSNTFENGAPIPGRCAFCVVDPATHVTFSANRNPHIAWSGAPAGTRSFAVVCVDPDVPSSGENVNREGVTVPAALPRVDFYHWILADIPPSTTEIAEGAHSEAVTPRGKPGPAFGTLRHGRNDYTGWFAGDPDMGGDYFGYDGPCPPWNDEIIHRYHFIVYALDVERAPIDGPMPGADFRAAIAPHVLAQAELVGTYTLNPALGAGA